MKKIFQNMKKKQLQEALVIIRDDLNEKLGPFSQCDPITRKMWAEKDEVLVITQQIADLRAQFS